jgi:hypothetical protein
MGGDLTVVETSVGKEVRRPIHERRALNQQRVLITK